MSIQNRKEKIVIIDFGSQVTKLIARRIRELGVYSEILTVKDFKQIKNYKQIKGIILSGGPSTVTKKKTSRYFKRNFFKRNTCSRNLLWTSVNSKNFWRYN